MFLTMFGHSSINAWFQKTRGDSFEHHYHLRGEPSKVVARLVFANFPNSMHVHGINNAATGICVN